MKKLGTIHIAYTQKELLEEMKKLHKADVIILDEGEKKTCNNKSSIGLGLSIFCIALLFADAMRRNAELM